MCWWTSIRPVGGNGGGVPPQPVSVAAARPSADHPSISRLDSSRTAPRRSRPPGCRGDAGAARGGASGSARPGGASARRFRLANWRVCITQCAGSRTATLTRCCSQRGRNAQYPLTRSRVRRPGSSVRRKPHVESVYRRGRRSAGSNCRPRRSSDMRRARNRSGSTAATCQDWLPSRLPVNRSPRAISCHSGWIRSALRRPKLSSRSQLYQPPRSVPICTSQGHTLLGGASMVTAIVAVRTPPGTRSAPGNGDSSSSSLAPQRSSRGRTSSA